MVKSILYEGTIALGIRHIGLHLVSVRPTFKFNLML